MNVTGIISKGDTYRHRLVPDIYVSIRFTTVSGTFVESPGGTWGAGAGYGLATLALPASTDGTFQSDFNGAAYDDVVIGWDAANTNTDYTGYDYALFVDSASQHYALVENGGAPVDSTVLAASGDKMRLRRSGSTILAEKTSDNTTWTSLGTFVATTSAKLYNKANSVAAGGYLLNPLGTGMA